jgi:hypothetical protein
MLRFWYLRTLEFQRAFVRNRQGEGLGQLGYSRQAAFLSFGAVLLGRLWCQNQINCRGESRHSICRPSLHRGQVIEAVEQAADDFVLLLENLGRLFQVDGRLPLAAALRVARQSVAIENKMIAPKPPSFRWAQDVPCDSTRTHRCVGPLQVVQNDLRASVDQTVPERVRIAVGVWDRRALFAALKRL